MPGSEKQNDGGVDLNVTIALAEASIERMGEIEKSYKQREHWLMVASALAVALGVIFGITAFQIGGMVTTAVETAIQKSELLKIIEAKKVEAERFVEMIESTSTEASEYARDIDGKITDALDKEFAALQSKKAESERLIESITEAHDLAETKADEINQQLLYGRVKWIGAAPNRRPRLQNNHPDIRIEPFGLNGVRVFRTDSSNFPLDAVVLATGEAGYNGFHYEFYDQGESIVVKQHRLQHKHSGSDFRWDTTANISVYDFSFLILLPSTPNQ